MCVFIVRLTIFPVSCKRERRLKPSLCLDKDPQYLYLSDKKYIIIKRKGKKGKVVMTIVSSKKSQSTRLFTFKASNVCTTTTTTTDNWLQTKKGKEIGFLSKHHAHKMINSLDEAYANISALSIFTQSRFPLTKVLMGPTFRSFYRGIYVSVPRKERKENDNLAKSIVFYWKRYV